MRSGLTRVAFGVGLAAVAALGACKNREGDADDRDTDRHAADTSVTERTVQDTTIVTHDTVVRSDTVVKKGGVVDSNQRKP
jgi:hypothetical protein